jgi:hypothetical protein
MNPPHPSDNHMPTQGTTTMTRRSIRPTALRHFVAGFAFLAMAALANSCHAAADANETEEGFTPLLQDSKHEGWVGYNQKQWPKNWEVADGVLHRASGGGDLMTEKEYGDFDLRFQWKISEGGNSGVMYRVKPSMMPAYYTGPEYQVLDNARHADGKNDLTSAGAIYALYPAPKDAAKPAGQWNDGQITIQRNRLTHYLNGKKVAEAVLGSQDWNDRVAKSKFADWKGFGAQPRGHIVLQDHGDEVWYRNLRIKELDAK